MMKFRSRVARQAKRVLKRSPQSLQDAARRILRRDTTVAENEAVSETAALLGVSPEIIGTTYTHDEILPMLALEGEALRRQLFDAWDELASLKKLSQEAQLESPTSESRVSDAARAASELASEYLAGQSKRAGSVRHLIIANDYPDIGREYGNGFIHRRVLAYREAGVDVDVVLAGPSMESRIYEFEGVRVLAGSGPEVGALLSQAQYRSVSAHFLNELMWEHLAPRMEELELHVYLHGYECDRWIRRVFNYPNGTALERGIDRSAQLQYFWRRVLNHRHQPKSYIFVSGWWQRAVTDDMGVVFPANRAKVVHNVIDTKLFNYVPKDVSQRFKLLWVRSAGSLKYGHDIAIKILKLLAVTPYWKQTEVTIIGDGKYFGEFERELGQYDNVRIERKFVQQEEISRLHKAHGIFLVPSRLDSQGVSRDEAMSSGLVPVTNLVTAIPEFVDEESAIVAGPNDAKSLAEGIIRVMREPNRFARMSEAASTRAAWQCGPIATVGREMEIMGLTSGEELNK